MGNDVATYDQGHIKLHRSLLESSLWIMRPESIKLAMYLLLRANWKDAEWFNKYQRKRVTVQRGELITSLDTLAIGTKLTRKIIRTSLKHLVDDGFILILNSDQKRARQFTHIRICKYDVYQNSFNGTGTPRAQDGHGTGTPRAQDGHGTGTPRATNEEGKEGKEENPLTPLKNTLTDAVSS